MIKILLSFLLYISYYPIIINAKNKPICDDKVLSLNCLKNNFKRLAFNNRNLFWKIIKNAEKDALKCDNEKSTVDFLEIEPLIGSNVEVQEYFSEVIETKLCVPKTSCFFDSLLKINKEERIKIISKLKNPMFEDKENIRAVFLKYKEVSKYEQITTLFFDETKYKKVEAKCKRGDQKACYDACLLDVEKGNIEKARINCQKGCLGKFFKACYMSGRFEYERGNKQKGHEYFKMACNGGENLACSELK